MQQAAVDPACLWQELNPSLFAATVLRARPGSGLSCILCQEVDHHAQDCALVYLQPSLAGSQQTPLSLASQPAITHQPQSLQGQPAHRSPPGQRQPRGVVYPGTGMYVFFQRPAHSGISVQPAWTSNTRHEIVPVPLMILSTGIARGGQEVPQLGQVSDCWG